MGKEQMLYQPPPPKKKGRQKEETKELEIKEEASEGQGKVYAVSEYIEILNVFLRRQVVRLDVLAAVEHDISFAIIRLFASAV